MAWPMNAELLQGITKTSFYGALQEIESELIYPKICMVIDQPDLTTTYTCFGGVPEPRQMSPTVASSGGRMAKALRDYKVAGTVAEFETTVTVPRSVIETNPGEIPRITQQMAMKCAYYLDRRFIATALPSATALGYDGIALYSTAHAETGASQDNALTHGCTDTMPTPAELETGISHEFSSIKNYTDDMGTPVNATVSRWAILCPIGFEYLYRSTLEPIKGQGLPDSSGASGRFRGMFTVYASPFVATEDRHYLFALRPGTAAVAMLKNKDWDIKTNIGTDSDLWNYNQTALFTAYGRFEFIPWDWKVTLREVWT